MLVIPDPGSPSYAATLKVRSGHLRISYATAWDKIAEAVERMGSALSRPM